MPIFVMHIRRQHCRCGASEQMSTLYQAEEVARPGQAQKLLPCHSIGPLDPVRIVELPTTSTPVCAQCVDAARATIGYDVYARWQETLKRKYAPAPVGGSSNPTKPKPEPTLDDLA
jgi:hypothetical protein